MASGIKILLVAEKQNAKETFTVKLEEKLISFDVYVFQEVLNK